MQSTGGIEAFHPLIAGWFTDRFGQPTDVQIRSWRAILSGKHTLIAAPTGSGKTLAGLLPCLNRILLERESADRGVKLIYITPLKALNNDIHHHVIGYIEELKRRAEALGLGWSGLTSGVRTGDTPQHARAAMLRNPPDVLVTTPESLYLLLTSPKARMMLKTVRYCIVDEIHDLAADRRGLHLSVTLERLTEWTGASPQRIGVSATQKPIGLVARFLGGYEPVPAGDRRGSGGEETEATGRDDHTAESAPEDSGGDRGYAPRDVEIIESRMDKQFRLRVTVPEYTHLTRDKQEAVWGPLTDHIMKLIEGCRSVLIFVNNRRLCERLTLRLNEHAGREMARSHHGSISREQRLEVEGALKAGELRCLVATSSLELGIDVGHIDLVVQIDSPKSAAAGIQRIGRAGHSVGDVSRGVIVARTRGQLPECAALARSIAAREIEDIRIPRGALDVLCQQVVAMVAADDWTLPQLRSTLARSYGYHGFPPERLEAVLQVLAGYYPFVRPLVDWDRERGLLSRRSSTAMAAIMGAGTIPQGSAYPVHHAHSHIHLGELDEEYIHESRAGDVFQLGTSSWRIQTIRSDRVYVVEEAGGNSFSEIPFWRGEGQGRSLAFSEEIGKFMEDLERRMDSEEKQVITGLLMESHHMDARAADELLLLLHAQKAAAALPTHRRIVIEQFQDDMKQHHLIIHSWFGRTFNRTWQLAIQAYAERRLPYRIYANAKDNGIEFVVADGGNGDALKLLPLIREVTSHHLERLLQEAIPGSPQFGITFRRLAETSLLLSRSFRRMPAWQKRLRSEELLRESLPYAEQFPFIREAIRICMQEELDVHGVREALRSIETGKLEVVVAQGAYPSPFAALFLADFINAQMYESDAVGKDLQANLTGLNRSLAGQWFEPSDSITASNSDKENADDGALAAVDSEETERVVVETTDDWTRLLKERGEFTEEELTIITGEGSGAASKLHELEREGKVRTVRLGVARANDEHGTVYWICADEADTYARLGSDPLAGRFIATRYVDRQARFTIGALQRRYGLDERTLGELIRGWEAEGRIEPSSYEEGPEERVWLNRRLLIREARRQAASLRQSVETIDPAVYCSRLMELQHVQSYARLSGEEGLKRIIGQLQGLFLPLSQWESSVFPLRLTDYKKELLDRLCAAGDVLWIGRKQEKEGRVAFFLAESRELYGPFLEQADPLNGGVVELDPAEVEGLGEPPSDGSAEDRELMALLGRKGASFLSALSRETGRVPSELTSQLVELAWKGLVSNDQFAPLRLNGSAKPGKARTAAGKGFQSGLGRWYALSSLKEEANYEPPEAMMAWIKQMLEMFGLLTKELAGYSPWSWDDLYPQLKQLENWGMLTRGLWVRDVKTMQFSTRERLGILQSRSWTEGNRPVVLPSTDPSNPFGLLVKWPEKEGIAFARKKGSELVMRGGRWLLWIENNGKRIYTMEELRGDELEELLRSAAADYLRYSGIRKLVVDKWNGKPVKQSEAADILLKLGAESDRDSLVIWPSSLR
ncbi:DEAD/DEAH box helicase [Paenibacillus doosanensis]|uniref:DEAD/DEAH box helicase n=1 Tax=Paenibacillus doosanensis TaxID=1229154 RepID=UPI00217FCD8C|nr:DEAD/DEAH box helicase [Paenibacillus doosanensis]MCS7460453.1 DEAD/DEAH box helicase [Paenibacillus doosanensis]